MKNFKLRKLAITFAIFTLSLSILVINFLFVPPPEKTLAGAMLSTHANPSCLDGYETWPQSNTYKADNSWNLDFLPSEYGAVGKEHFLDINGDGLLDYVYTYSRYWNSSGAFFNKDTCVYLNNGNGWEKVYRCISKSAQDYYKETHPDWVDKFYGDCAQL